MTATATEQQIASRRLFGIFEETAWQHRGRVTSITFRVREDGDTQLTITAVSQKGKFYVQFIAEDMETTLDMYYTFLTSKASPHRWRKSKW